MAFCDLAPGMQKNSNRIDKNEMFRDPDGMTLEFDNFRLKLKYSVLISHKSWNI